MGNAATNNIKDSKELEQVQDLELKINKLKNSEKELKRSIEYLTRVKKYLSEIENDAKCYIEMVNKKIIKEAKRGKVEDTFVIHVFYFGKFSCSEYLESLKTYLLKKGYYFSYDEIRKNVGKLDCYQLNHFGWSCAINDCNECYSGLITISLNPIK